MEGIERDELDERMDESLRTLGARLTDAPASGALRARVRAVLEGSAGEEGREQTRAGKPVPREQTRDQTRAGKPVPLEASVRRLRWSVAGLGALAAVMALGVVGVWMRGAGLAQEGRRLRAEVVELRRGGDALQVGQNYVAGRPAHTGEEARYLVVTLHHEVCPRSREVTPLFKHLPEEFAEAPAIFIVLDVSPKCRGVADEMGARFGCNLMSLFLDKGYPSTGAVKVVDLRTCRVVYTMEWPMEFPALETYLKGTLASR